MFNRVFKLKQQETQSYILVIQEDFPVRNLKPAVVKVYDYYQTSMNTFRKGIGEMETQQGFRHALLLWF